MHETRWAGPLGPPNHGRGATQGPLQAYSLVDHRTRRCPHVSPGPRRRLAFFFCVFLRGFFFLVDLRFFSLRVSACFFLFFFFPLPCRAELRAMPRTFCRPARASCCSTRRRRRATTKPVAKSRPRARPFKAPKKPNTNTNSTLHAHAPVSLSLRLLIRWLADVHGLCRAASQVARDAGTAVHPPACRPRKPRRPRTHARRPGGLVAAGVPLATSGAVRRAPVRRAPPG